jgi:ribonuclease HI
MQITIWTDGGCHGNPGPGGWAFIITAGGAGAENTVLCENNGGEKATTNNKMELCAVINALERLNTLDVKANADVEVCTDSQYVQKGITEWIYNWKAKGWRTSGKQPVKNQDLWRKLDALVQAGYRGVPFRWKWVKGHAGNYYNERCDALVQDAINAIAQRGNALQY